MKILVVEDEEKMSAFIKKGLEEQEYEVEIAYDGAIGKRLVLQNKYDVMIFDVNIPQINGFELAKLVRANQIATPILMLTAFGTTDDKITGFESGADDYLVKPFEFRELIARIKALSKRNTENLVFTTNNIIIANLEINLEEKWAKRDNKKIDLTSKEFYLLEYLAKHKGKVISRTEIAEKVWDINFDTGTNVIDVYINFLRKKIDKDFQPKLIHTMVGMGYVLRVDE